jgi:hypothetical protein
MLDYNQIDEILRSLDIEGLIELGAPTDEYISESKDIEMAIKLLRKEDSNEESLVKIIQAIWMKNFGPFSDNDIELRMPEFRKLAYWLLK